MKKVGRQINLSAEVDEHIITSFPEKEFSSWVEQQYRDSFMSFDMLKKQKQDYSDKLKSIEQQLEFLKNFQKEQRAEFKQMDKKELQFWSESDRILNSPAKMAQYLQGRISFYFNEFGSRLTAQDFLCKLQAFRATKK